MPFVAIAKADIEHLRMQLLHAALKFLCWVLPLITFLSFLRIPVTGLLPVMNGTALITVIVLGLYYFRVRFSTHFKAGTMAVIGIGIAIQSYISFGEPARLVMVLLIPILIVAVSVKKELSYLYAIASGMLPLALHLVIPNYSSLEMQLREVATVSAVATCGFVLMSHLISSKLISFLQISQLRERTLERTDAVSGALNEFALRERIDEIVNANDAPLLRIYQLYLPELDVSKSLYSRNLREQYATHLSAAFTVNFPTNSVFGRLNNGSYVVLAKRADWSAIEAALRQLRGTQYSIASQTLSFDPVVVTTDAPIDGATSDQLLDNLARVLDRAQRDRVEFARYLPIDQALLDTEYLFAGEVGQAMEMGDLQLYLQPKVSTQPGNPVVGAEALIRWMHPTQGLLAPGAFLQQIENSNARTGFALFVIRRSAEILNELRELMPQFELSFNLNAYDLQELRVLAELQRVVEEYEFPTGALQIEVSESETTVHIDSLKRAIQAVRDLGYSTSLDDFGTGMCSLAYFSVIPVDTVKVDRAFLGSIEESPTGQSVLRSIVELCKGVNCRAVVEGVETPQQVKIVSDMGFDLMQGYFFGKPLTVERFKAQLQKSQVDRTNS